MTETFRRVHAIPTKYRGVPMRSRLEAHVAAVLDQTGIPWTYEPKVYWVPGIKGSGYLPDFRLWPGRPNPWFVEVKPTGIYDDRHTDPTDLRNAIEKLLRVRYAEPQATLVLWVADPRDKVNAGRLLIHVPGAAGWIERPAVTWLRTAKRTLGATYRRRPWWRRLLGR